MGFLAELKKLVYDQTQKLGVTVSNIYGAAQPILEKLSAAEQSSWLVLTVPSRTVPSVENFYALYTSLPTAAAQSLDTTTGAVVFQYSGQNTVSVLLRGTIEVTQPRSINLAVDTSNEQAAFIVQLDGHVIRSGVGSKDIGVYLDTGVHVLEVFGASNILAVQVPADLRVSSSFERVPTPTWASATTGYLDAAQGASTVKLSWYVDPKAGGWRVLRRQLVTVAAINSVSAVDSQSEYSVILAGDQTSLLTGQQLFAAHELLGIILNTRLDSGNTVVRLRLPAGRNSTSPHWPGQTAMTGTFTEIQRVGRTQAAGIMVWNDNSVKTGDLYDYALQAWGFLDSNTWSAQSAVQTVRAGDTDAPASVVFDAGYPTVVDRVVRARFTTPSDADYAGVRVYRRDFYTGTATSATSTTLTNTAGAFGTLTTAWTLRIVSGTGAGQERQVASNTSTTITVSSAWETTPNNTSVYLAFKDTVIKTDYGLPGATDQFDFEPLSTDPSDPPQLYHFRTFDAALNEQMDSVCATWTYDPGADGTWTSPPIVGIRQVPATHPTLVGQDDFTAPFNNPKNYAIVELSASDVAGRRGDITISYQRRGDSSPVLLAASANPTTEGGTPATLDNPSGTRSRYVAIDRTTGDNWIKVYAKDSDGNQSDVLTYAVDYDDAAEISSLEGRLEPATVFTSAWNNPGITNLWFGSGTSGTAGVIWITGAGDDDAQGLKYWLEDPTGTDPTVSSPRVLDLRTSRAFAFAFSLGEGQRKKLILEPWSGYSGSTVAGVAGVRVEREFTRPARSQAHFEDRDSNGNVSGKTVKVLLDVFPAPSVQTSVTVGSVRTVHASASTATTLRDSGSPGWTTDQWATGEAKKFFVIAGTGSGTQTRTIVSNSANTLTVDPAWTTIPHNALFWIVDSAVMYRLDESGGFSAAAAMELDSVTGATYKTTSGLVFFNRKEGDASTVLEYYAAKNKVPNEPTVRTRVDADTIPEFGDLTLSEVSPNNLRVTAVAPDDDVKVWRAYRRKGTWPTLTGSIPTPFTSADLDRQYLHHSDTVQHLTYDSYAGTGQQYVVIVPTNSMNQDGPPVSKTQLVTGNAATPQLTNVAVEHVDNGALAGNRVSWAHANIADASTVYHVKVYAYRKVTATGAIDVTSAELTPGGFTRLATYDSQAGSIYLNTDDTATSVSGSGSWIHMLPTNYNTRATAFTGTAYTWVYTVELYGVSDAFVGAYTVEDTDYYEPLPCTVTSCSASITNPGTSLTGYCQSNPTRQVTWATANTNDAGYSISIELATDSGATTWSLIASGLNPSTGAWTQTDNGYAGGGTTEVRYWTYRAWAVKRSNGAQSGSKQTATQLTDTIDYCLPGGVV